MRILFLSDNFPPETNAAASRVFERACYWVRWGHAVTIITCAPNFPDGKVYAGYRNDWYTKTIVDGMTVVRVKTFLAPNRGRFFRTIDFLSYIVPAFVAALRESRPDVVVATSPQFFVAVTGWLVAAVRRVPFVFELSDLWPASIVAVGAMRNGLLLRIVEHIELFLYHRAARVVALTQAFKENLVSRGVPSAKVVVIQNGVDTARYIPRPRDDILGQSLQLLPHFFVVGYIGTHGMAHALEHVLLAAEALADTPHVRFLFVGAGAERDALIAEAERRGLSNTIFVSAQPKEEIPRYWSLCTIALIHLRNAPIFSSVLPSKMFEAMAMGLPLLLAAPRGEAQRLIESDGVGSTVPPEDPEALAAAIRAYAADPSALEQYRARSIPHAMRYSREAQARAMMQLFEAV